jgi:hypothetical protein
MAVDYWISGPDQIGKGYALVLISCIGSQMNGHGLIRWGGGTLAAAGAASRWGVMAAHRRWVARWQRYSIHYTVSSYGFGTTWGIQFTNLGQRRRAIPSGRWWCSSLWLGRRWGSPLVNLQLPEWDENLAGVHLSFLCWFKSSNWRWKLSSMATYGSTCSPTCGQKSKHNRSVFIGGLVPMRRGFDFLMILSRSRLQIAADKEESKRG